MTRIPARDGVVVGLRQRPAGERICAIETRSGGFDVSAKDQQEIAPSRNFSEEFNGEFAFTFVKTRMFLCTVLVPVSAVSGVNDKDDEPDDHDNS